MKRITWITCLLLCAFCTIQAKDRVIERPPFTVWNSRTIEIDKIVIGDTATTVYIKAFYEPKQWIKIVTGSFLKDNNGALYPIRRGIGITLDKEFWMPESGEAEFQLIFPPIPETVTSVDFIEGDLEGAYRIWGIQLDKKAFDKEKLPQGAVIHKMNKRAELPIPTLAFGKATLKGKILDLPKEMLTECRIHICSPALRNNYENALKVNEDGTFQVELGLPTVTNAVLIFPYGHVRCFVAPNEETSVIINTKEICRRRSRLQSKGKSYGEPTYFNGYLAGLQQELGAIDPNTAFPNDDFETKREKMARMNAEEYKKYLLKSVPIVRKRIAKARYSSACKELLNNQLDIIIASGIALTVRDLEYAYISVNKLEREKARDYFRDNPIDIPEGYYNVLKEFSSINTLKSLYNDINYEQMFRFLELIPDMENVLKKALETDKGPLFDKIEVNKLYTAIKDLTPLTAEQKVQLKTSLSPAYEELLLLADKESLQKIELNKKKSGFSINEAGEVINEELFPSIISKFRGHVLFIDFWATWCGPCRSAMKEMSPMKEKFKDKDVIYLFITGETSPIDTWKNMIREIHGEHFRVKDNQWDYLMQSFNIRGIPTYFIVDREGNITYRQSGFPGVKEMEEQLLKALEK